MVMPKGEFIRNCFRQDLVWRVHWIVLLQYSKCYWIDDFQVICLLIDPYR